MFDNLKPILHFYIVLILDWENFALEEAGYNKHPEVGPLIQEIKNLGLEVIECLDEMQRKFTTSASPSTSSSYTKLYELLPSKVDLSSEWIIGKSIEYNKATKSFYYENAGQTKYEKDVNFMDVFRMNVFRFFDSQSAQKEYDEKYRAVIDRIGYWQSDGTYKTFTELIGEGGHVIVDAPDCVIINDTDSSKDKILGWCVVDKYMIYLTIEGFYPEMEKDAIDFMNIARQKVNSKT